MKKIIVLFFTVFACFVLVGCEKSYDFDAAFEAIFEGIDVDGIKEAELNLPVAIESLKIKWESNNEAVLRIDHDRGKVTRTYEDEVVTLTATMTYLKQEKVKTINLTILKLNYNTVADFYASDAGVELEVKGVVVAINARSFLVSDATGSVLVYLNSLPDVILGDEVIVKGKVVVYSKSKQFDSSCTYDIIGTKEVPSPVVDELDAAECDEYKSSSLIVAKKVQIKGKLSISGNYINISIPGATIQGSLKYPIDMKDFTDFDGKNVVVVGYAINISGTNNAFLDIMFTCVVLDTETPVGPVEVDIEEIKNLDSGSECIVTGVVVATDSRGFIVKDSTGYVLVFKGSSYAKDLAVGDKVKVNGVVAVYEKAKQLNEASTYVKLSNETVIPPTVNVLSGADVAGYMAEEVVDIEFVTVTGKLTINGSNYYINFDGQTVVVSITYPVDASVLTPFKDKEITISGYITNARVNSSQISMVAVMLVNIGEPAEVEIKTIAEFYTSENDTEVAVKGIVVAVNAQSFLISDETGSVLIYCGNTFEKDVAIGDEVLVSGKVKSINKSKQFDASCTYEKVETKEIPIHVVEELDAAECEVYKDADNVTVKKVQLKGKLVISGNYVNIEIPGATIVGSLKYPIDMDTLETFEGENVVIVGYLINVSGSSTKYLDIMFTSVVLDTETPVDPDDSVKLDFTNNTDFAKWGTSYVPQTLTVAGYTIDFSRANKQTGTITDIPVLATRSDQGHDLVTVSVTGDFSNFTSVSFELKQWNTKVFDRIYLEYTTDGTTWIKCSDEISKPGLLSSNISIAGAVGVRLVLNEETNTGNHQVGLAKIIFS